MTQTIPLLIATLALSACVPTFESIVHLPDDDDDATAFRKVDAPFEHRWKETSHPFSGAAVIDIDGDGREEIFVGGGEGQKDALFRYESGRLIYMPEALQLSSDAATHGATAIDIDSDGDTDLLVARTTGVSLYLNSASGFSTTEVPLKLAPEAVPFQVAVSDINRDGQADLYISVFVATDAFRSATYNDPAHAKQNILLLNNGDLTFTDITKESGTAGRQNTFTSVFNDLNADGWPDLILAQNTGEIEIFRNLGNASEATEKGTRFESIDTNTGYGFWMGLALGDIDRDGDQDLYFSNIGTSIPDFLTSGDLLDDQRQETDWLLWRNDGEFKFTDVTQEYGIKDYGFAWGAVFEDIDLDGQLDLLVAQNYLKWPLHKLGRLPGKVLLQRERNGSAQLEQADGLAINNPHYGQSPIILDFNGDSKPDLLWLNMNGPLRAFLNRTPNNSLAVALPDNLSSAGANVTVITPDGASYTRQVVGSIGLMTDQSSTLFFGLGANKTVKQIDVRWADGSSTVISEPLVNTTVRIDRN